MREAVARMRNLDLVLMDTAGRSPRDEIKIQELRSLLAEAEADDVLLVLSATAGTKSLAATAEKFAEVGTTALLLTKLDEATSLGHLVALVRQCRLPISYLTDGQNVPDDIQVAEPRQLAYLMLSSEVRALGRSESQNDQRTHTAPHASQLRLPHARPSRQIAQAGDRRSAARRRRRRARCRRRSSSPAGRAAWARRPWQSIWPRARLTTATAPCSSTRRPTPMRPSCSASTWIEADASTTC